MAQIDLKNAKIYIGDGFGMLGAINSPAGHAIGTTTINVDGFTAAIEATNTFTIEGDETTYVVVSSVGGATPTAITFTPGLVVAVSDAAEISVLSHSVEIDVGDGTLTFDEKRNLTYTKNKGRLNTVRLGDEEPMAVSFEFVWEWITAAAGEPPTIEDVLKHRGPAATWISSSADPCEPYAVNIMIDYRPECADVDWERIILEDFRHDTLTHNIKDGKVSCSGSCNRTEATTLRVPAVA